MILITITRIVTVRIIIIQTIHREDAIIKRIISGNRFLQ